MSTRAAATAFGCTCPSGFKGGSFLDKMVMSSTAAATSSCKKVSMSTVIRRRLRARSALPKDFEPLTVKR